MNIDFIVEGSPGSGRSSFLKQIALDWGRGASYLQHFNLIILLDCATLVGQDFDKQIMKMYRIMKQEKVNLQKWEVQNEPFLLLLDSFDKLPKENLEVIYRIISGETYTMCSVLAASTEGKSVQKNPFKILIKLKGWKQETVIEVIHRQSLCLPLYVITILI